MDRNTYRPSVPLEATIEAKVEKAVAEALRAMSEHMKIPSNELINTALKRFIATHSDYLPKKK